MLTVPTTITPALAEFCRSISAELPIYIRSKSPPDARPSECFNNVTRKIGRDGGQVAYGWAIWHLPALYFEAEQHCVWRKESGKLVDVSPQPGRGPKMLFLPSPTAVYDPQRFRRNIIRPAATGVVAANVAALAIARNEIVDRYRAEGYNVVPFDGELLAINERLKVLLRIAGIEF